MTKVLTKDKNAFRVIEQSHVFFKENEKGYLFYKNRYYGYLEEEYVSKTVVQSFLLSETPTGVEKLDGEIIHNFKVGDFKVLKNM